MLSGLTVAGVASFAALIVVAGSPARSVAGLSVASLGSAVPVEIAHTTGVVSISPQTGKEIAAGAIDDLRLITIALSRRDPARAAAAAGGAYLTAAEDADRDGRRSNDRRPELPRHLCRPTAAAGRRAGTADGRRDADRSDDAAQLLGRLLERPERHDDAGSRTTSTSR